MYLVPPINLLRKACPPWFAITDVEPGEFRGVASPFVAGAASALSLRLRIAELDRIVMVAEAVVGTDLPTCCPDRHVNTDGTFCIGIDAGNAIVSPDTAAVWWDQLAQYIRLQRVAQRTGMWPVRQGLAHGDAGQHQIAAREAAAELGIEEQYFETLEGAEAWFVAGFPKLDKSEMRLLNQRLPCPMGCVGKGKRILRIDCCNSQAVVSLLREERLRRKLEAEFWKRLKEHGIQCCRTLRNCPLASTGAASDKSDRVARLK